MLIIKSKYKIAKRLGAGVFDQTQTQKFSLSEARAKAKPRGRRGGSDYGRQLIEKQRVRYTYGLSEKHLSNYVQKSMHAQKPSAALHKLLEMRVDNVVYRAGLASTRRAARQIVSHGHVLINGRRTTIPSQMTRKDDVVSIREGSRTSALFAGLGEKNEAERRGVPNWLETDVSLLNSKVVGEPAYTGTEGL